jgi:hypothetical protein
VRVVAVLLDCPSDPLYGPRRAGDFYPALSADTSRANLTLRSVTTGEEQTGRPMMSFWFHVNWRLAALT